MPEEAVRVGFQRRLAPHHDDLGELVALVVPAARQRAGIVPFGVRRAGDVGGRRQTRRVAGIARLHVAVVGRAEHHGGIERHRAAFAARAGHADDGLGAVLLADALVVLLHDGERLVPRALFPRLRVPAVGAGALERGQDARRAVHVVLEGDAPGAQAALGDGMVLVAFHLDQPTLVVHVQLEAAAHRMAAGRRPRARARDG